MRVNHEVWANDRRWRMITLYVDEPISVQYSWGSYDYPVDHFIKMFHGSLSATMDGAHGSGHERWYNVLTKPQALNRITKIRTAATKAGFKNLGTL